MSKHKCHRCGKCCENMGTIWLQSPRPEIQKVFAVYPVDLMSDGGRCAMLTTGHEQCSCLLELIWGKLAKPEVCRQYPDPPDFDGKCHRDIIMARFERFKQNHKKKGKPDERYQT